jgi:hypothetical protein
MEPLDIFNNSFIAEGFRVYKEEQTTKKYHKHSVFANVIKQLVIIYGAENIINLYENNNELEFTKALVQYGFCYESLQKWLGALEAFYRDNKMPNYFFELIQEGLIDMYVYRVKKTKNFGDKEEFEKLLYIDNSPYLIIRLYNLLHNKNIKSINAYWESRLFELENPIEFIEPIKLLEPKLYENYGLTIDEVKKMSKNQIEQINKKITEAQSSSSDTGGGRTKTAESGKKLVLAAN